MYNYLYQVYVWGFLSVGWPCPRPEVLASLGSCLKFSPALSLNWHGWLTESMGSTKLIACYFYLMSINSGLACKNLNPLKLNMKFDIRKIVERKS